MDLDGGLAAGGANVPANVIALRIFFVAAADCLDALDARRVTDPQCPKGAVQVVAAPVPQPAGAEIPPITPVERMETLVIVPVR